MNDDLEGPPKVQEWTDGRLRIRITDGEPAPTRPAGRNEDGSSRSDPPPPPEPV